MKMYGGDKRKSSTLRVPSADRGQSDRCRPACDVSWCRDARVMGRVPWAARPCGGLCGGGAPCRPASMSSGAARVHEIDVCVHRGWLSRGDFRPQAPMPAAKPQVAVFEPAGRGPAWALAMHTNVILVQISRAERHGEPAIARETCVRARPCPSLRVARANGLARSPTHELSIERVPLAKSRRVTSLVSRRTSEFEHHTPVTCDFVNLFEESLEPSPHGDVKRGDFAIRGSAHAMRGSPPCLPGRSRLGRPCAA